MSEENTGEAGQSQEGAGEATDGGLSPEQLAAELKRARADAARFRTELKSLKPLADKAKELEEAGKTEIQKATEKLTAAEQRAQAAELHSLRLEVAFSQGLTPAQAKRLVGTTREELEADAKELLESFGGGEPPKPAGKPKERLKSGQGGDPDDDLDTLDPDKLAALIPRSVF